MEFGTFGSPSSCDSFRLFSWFVPRGLPGPGRSGGSRWMGTRVKAARSLMWRCGGSSHGRILYEVSSITGWMDGGLSEGIVDATELVFI